MNFARWLLMLLDACAEARGPWCRSDSAMRRLVARWPWLFEGRSDRESLQAMFGRLSDADVAYHVVQERRAARASVGIDPDDEGDPDRGTQRGGGVALGLRTLLRPSYFRRGSRTRERSRVRTASEVGFKL